MWTLKDDDYQTSYDDQPVDGHGVQQEAAPVEEEEEAVGGEEQQEEEEEDTAEGSQVFDTEEVWWDSIQHCILYVDVGWLHFFFFFLRFCCKDSA